MYIATSGEYEVTIRHDMNPENPRDWDNLGTMVCWHRRYNLGDKHNYDTRRAFLEDFADDLCRQRGLDPKEVSYLRLLVLIGMANDRIMIPVYLYDHSGLSISTSDFGDRWDSGQVGWIFARPETIRSWYRIKKITPEILAKVEYTLRCEVKVYDDYLTGNAWGFELTKNGEYEDSCWGFIGDINGSAWDEIKDCLPDCFADAELEEVFE